MKIVNKNPNASTNVNGIDFAERNGHMVSVGPVDGEARELLLSIPGFFALDHAPASTVETKLYTDGATATGTAPLPELSPAQQEGATGNSGAAEQETTDPQGALTKPAEETQPAADPVAASIAAPVVTPVVAKPVVKPATKPAAKGATAKKK